MWDATMGVVFSQNGTEKQDLALSPMCPIAKGYTRTTHNHRPGYLWGISEDQIVIHVRVLRWCFFAQIVYRIKNSNFLRVGHE